MFSSLFSRKILLLPIVICGLNQTAAACSCAELLPVEQALDVSSAVFVGQVEVINNNPLMPDLKEIKFSIRRRIKGLEEWPTATVLVYTASSSATCGYNFLPGLDYLVYASGSIAKLQVGLCSRTQVLEKALAEVAQLEDMFVEVEVEEPVEKAGANENSGTKNTEAKENTDGPADKPEASK